jgi:sortase A
VARLRADTAGKEFIVLDSQAGAALAFGPGLLKKGAEPGQPGTCILAGHRDTSFRFLEHVRPGDIFTLQDRHGRYRQYRATTMAVRQAEELYIENSTDTRLLLITCYPFDGLLPGTPLRYVVTAEPAGL